MNRVSNYYKKRLTSSNEQDKWEYSTTAEEKILALETKITGILNKRKRESSDEGKKAKKACISPKKAKPEWLVKDTAPGNIKAVREHAGYKYYWCCKENGGKCGGKWRHHKPTECRGTAQLKSPPSEDKKKPAAAKKMNSKERRRDAAMKRIQLEEAKIKALMDESSDESKDEESHEDEEEESDKE